MKLKLTKVLALCILIMGLCALPMVASATQVVKADVDTAGSGNVMVGIEGSYVTVFKDQILARINEIRKEAYDEGLAGSYVPIKWSKALEKITQVRAVEATVKMGHERPIGGYSLTTMAVDGVDPYAENVAYSVSGTMFDIEQWYSEKSDYVKGTAGATTGHYEALIDPSYKYIGVATFDPKESLNGGWNTTCANFSSGSGLDESSLGISGACIQLIEVPASHISDMAISGTTSLIKGNTTTLKAAAKMTESGMMGSQTAQVVFPSTSWSSSNTAVATVNSSGVVTGIKAGTASITAKAGSLSAMKAVTVADAAKSIAKATVGSITAKVYTGKAIKPSVTVKLGSTKLVSGTDYTVSYSNNKAVGKAKVTITGKGLYTGTVTKTFKINPKATAIAKVTKAKKAFTVKWKKKSGITGYQIRYSTKSSMAKAKTVKVKGAAKTSKKVSKLKAKKKYYVQVRTYKVVKGATYYSKWSKKKSVTTK